MFKRRQFGIMVKHMNEITYVNDVPTLHVKKEDIYTMSENYVFRNKAFHIEKTTINYAGVVEREYYGQFLVLRNDKDGVDPTTDNRPQDVLLMGVKLTFDEKLAEVFGVSEMMYKRCLRSASQFRTAKLLACPEGLLEDVRMHASYGWLRSIENKTLKSVAKVEPYIGLGLSSSLSAGRGWTDVNIQDAISQVNIKGAKSLDKINGVNTIVNYDEFVGKTSDEFKLTDGQSICTPEAGVRIAFRVGQISKREYRILRDCFATGVTMKDMLETKETARIWAKISRGFQFRYGLKKGFMVIAEHNYVDNNGRRFDFVFPEGANKGEVKAIEHVYENGELKTINHAMGVHPSVVELCITNVSPTKEKEWGLLNYQFIMSLNTSFPVLQALASKAIKKIVSALDSADDAMAFIGMVDNGDEEAYEEQNAMQKIRSILQANPEKAFKMKWVQAKIKQLMVKSIKDMGKGRIPLEDSRFAFIITDSTMLEKNSHGPAKGLLGPGEYYYNGQVGKRAIFRSPLIHKSEPVMIDLVKRPELDEAFGHMKNILIVNGYDDTLPRMGGADTDGDKVYLTSEPAIINDVETGLPMIYGDTENEIIPPIVWKNGGKAEIFKYDLNTLLPSQIGIVTDYCTSIADKARDARTNATKSEDFWELVSLGRILQGKIIDDAKKGTNTDIDNRLEVKYYPTWLKPYGRHTYESQSPIGLLYSWINNTVMPAFEEKYGDLEDYQINILLDYKNYKPAELNRILSSVQELEQSYRQDVGAYFEEHGPEPSPDMFPTKEAYREVIEERRTAFEELVLRHQCLLATIDASTTTIGMACVHVAENLQRSAKDKIGSYPFVIASDYVTALLADQEDSYKLVRVNNVDADMWEGKVMVMGNGRVYNENRDHIAMVKGVRGNWYDTAKVQGKCFIKVPVETKVTEVERSDEKLVQFEMKAYKKLAGWSEEQAYVALYQQSVELRMIENDKGRWLGVMFNGKQVGAVGKETLINANFVEGHTMKVVSLQPIKGILKVTAQVGEEVKVEEAPVQMNEESYVVNELPADMQIGFDFNIGM